MKKLLHTLIFIGIMVNAQTTYVPDDNFESKLISLGYDDVMDNYVQTENISGITTLNVYNSNISDLTGIEDFISLETLKCGSNLLSSLNVSSLSNLIFLGCESNQLTSLDVSSNSQLVDLFCNNNQLTNLNLNGANLLNQLNCGANNLTTLDVSTNLELVHLECFSNNLNNLNLEGLIGLTFLSCFDNQLTDLDISTNLWLLTLDCEGNQITSLDISENTHLSIVYCYNNQLTEIITGENPYLSTLYCQNNQLTHLEFNYYSPTSLNCSNNQISTLVFPIYDLRLNYLNCSNNQLTHLDFRYTPFLIELDCSNNQMEYLNLRKAEDNSFSIDLDELNTTGNSNLFCIQVDNIEDWSESNYWINIDEWTDFNENCGYPPYLTFVPDDALEQALIDLGYDNFVDDYVFTENINQLSSLDVSNKTISDLTGMEDFISLEQLNCSENNLTEFNFSNNSQLISLRINNNEITNLDISNNPLIAILYCSNNELTSLNLKNRQDLSSFYFEAKNNPDLNCIEVDDLDFAYNNWNNSEMIDDGVIFSLDCENLSISEENSSSIFAYPNPVKDFVYFNEIVKEIAVYDISKKLVYQSNISNNKFSLKSLPKGNYILIGKNKNGNVFIEKIIKK
ncbi:MAG: T9SS type A sorting domain-containing protein [Moheibacter sp.]